MTIDQGSEISRYQGVVALDGRGLEGAAHQYFQQSEQIPTRVRLAVAAAHKGASVNDVTDAARVDALTGNAAFSGTPVEVSAVARVA